MKCVPIRYGVTFGKCDASDWIDYEVGLTDDEAAAYDKAVAAGVSLNNVPELQDALQRAYEEIEEFREGFEPYSPYDEGWTLNVQFVDPSEY